MNSGVCQGWWSGEQGDEDAGYPECGTTEPRQGGGMDRQVQEAELVDDYRAEHLTGDDERHDIRLPELGVKGIEAAT